MKINRFVVLAVLVMAVLCGCIHKTSMVETDSASENIVSANNAVSYNVVETVSEANVPVEIENPIIPPELSQIRSICELATLECYFHNVAKSVKAKGSGISHVGEKDRRFWVEYTGVAKIGISMSKVDMEIIDNIVVVTIPRAELQSYQVADISESNFVFEKDSANSNPITADDQTAAVNEAQEKMRATIEKDEALLIRAEERAKDLIKNYIEQLGQASGIEYEIHWKSAEK